MDTDLEYDADDAEPDETEPIAKPTYVKVAGWLLVPAPLVGSALPIALIRPNPVAAIATASVTVLVLYGLFAVNLNLAGARLAGGWGSLVLGLLSLLFVVPTGGCGLLISAFCFPIAVLLLAPAESRAWFGR